MAQSIDAIPVGNTWININIASTIPVGTAMTLMNRGGGKSKLYLAEGNQPTADSIGSAELGSVNTNYAQGIIPAGSLAIWARSAIDNVTTLLSVQYS